MPKLSRKKILIILLVLPLVAFFLQKKLIRQTKAIGQVLQASNNCETRAVWLNDYAFNSDSRRQDILNKINQAHLNTVFVASYTTPYGDGWSNKTDFDTFLRNYLKPNNISVHVWLACMDRTGNVDFSQQSERNAQAQWAVDWLTQYPELDGVHLDYIRYPWDSYNQTLTNNVTQTVKTIHDGMVAAGFAKKILSAAVFRPGEARFVNQDPVTWINSGYVDFILPMSYITSDSGWNSDVNTLKAALGQNFSKVAMGLGWLQESGHPEWGYDAAGIVRKINYGQTNGMKGYAIFELGYPNIPSPYNDYDLVNAVASGPFSQSTSSCMISNIAVSPTPAETPKPSPTPPPSLTPTPPLSPTPSPNPYDLDGDEQVNAADVLILLGNWRNDSQGDFNSDSKINSLDFSLLITHWTEPDY